jgi:hypothetical protein
MKDGQMGVHITYHVTTSMLDRYEIRHVKCAIVSLTGTPIPHRVGEVRCTVYVE